MSERKKVEVSKKTVEDIVKIELDRNKKIETMRSELIKLSRIGSIDNTVQYINRATPKNIEKMYNLYNEQRLIKINDELSKKLISGVSQILSAVDLIGDSAALEDALNSDELLREEIFKTTGSLTPDIPYIGFASGSFTVAQHIYNHKTGGVVEEEILD